MTADELAEALGMQAHPEGGRYVETWRGPDVGGRATGTAIYFLLVAGERSHWHRVDADEIWLFHAGDPLAIEVAAAAGSAVERRVLGSSVARRRASAGRGAGRCLAVGDAARCVDARELRRHAGLRVRGVRVGSGRVDAVAVGRRRRPWFVASPAAGNARTARAPTVMPAKAPAETRSRSVANPSESRPRPDQRCDHTDRDRRPQHRCARRRATNRYRARRGQSSNPDGRSSRAARGRARCRRRGRRTGGSGTP